MSADPDGMALALIPLFTADGFLLWLFHEAGVLFPLLIKRRGYAQPFFAGTGGIGSPPRKSLRRLSLDDQPKSRIRPWKWPNQPPIDSWRNVLISSPHVGMANDDIECYLCDRNGPVNGGPPNEWEPLRKGRSTHHVLRDRFSTTGSTQAWPAAQEIAIPWRWSLTIGSSNGPMKTGAGSLGLLA